MRYLILFSLMIFCNLGYAQFFVGDSKEAVLGFLIENNVKFTEAKLSDTTSRISVLYEKEYQMIWVLNSDNVVIKQTLIPESKNGVNEFVRWFNEDFVRISDTEWRNYANGRIYRIQLIYFLKEPLFSITLSPDSK
ncbi:MAG: hypothetical protein J0L99_03660 [Chitinophagales bacterium]|nr:hypothetical protein [Chitinophagales bacterium]